MSNENAASFQDRSGKTWSTAVTVNTVRRVKELVGVDLLDVFNGRLFTQLMDDPVLLVNTLYAVCQPQAEQNNVSDEQFGEQLVGDTIAEATAALTRGIIDFFPRDRRPVLEQTWTAINQVQDKGMTLATAKLKSPLMQQTIEQAMRQAENQIDQRLIEFGRSFGSSPAQSASTQDH